MHKFYQLFNTLIFGIFFLVSCNVTPPRDRPTISPLQNVGVVPEEEIVEESIPTRPDGAIVIQSNICGCKNGVPITVGNCASVCASKAKSETSFLHFSVTPSAEVTLSDLRDLFGWCNTELIDPNTGTAVEGQTNPACVLEATDENDSKLSLNFSPISGSDQVSVDITALSQDMTYRIRIVETTSGASSNTKQMRIISSNDETSTNGPLALMPVTQYTCMSVTTSSDQVNLFYDDASRMFFYFIPETRPDPIPQGIVNLYCHDIFTYGETDHGDERLEETPGVFTLWNRLDPRFFNLNATGSELDINDIIEQKVKDMGSTLSSTPNIFFPFEWFGSPEIVDSSGTDEATGSPKSDVLGFYMTPFIDKDTLKAFCPTQDHYFSNNALFKAMREVVAVDTEGIYIGKKENSSTTFVLVRESLLKQIWFYKENGINIEPNNDTISGKKLQFYWPADTSTPFIKKSHQSTYTILSSDDLKNLNGAGSNTSQATNNANSSSGTSANFPPHDKRIGCIPVTEN